MSVALVTEVTNNEPVRVSGYVLHNKQLVVFRGNDIAGGNNKER